MDDFLNEYEKGLIGSFVENEAQFEAVKKVILWAMYGNGVLQKGKKAEPLKNHAFWMVRQNTTVDNAILGQSLRATWDALMLLEGALDEMKKYKPVKVAEKKRNPAV